MVLEDKYIGLALAISSSLGIGTSFVLTKKGLNQASERHGFEGEGFSYFKSPLWWAGMATMGLGEVANFAAYAFAPAILVTPLGALSVLIGSVLGAYFLKERLGTLGKLGCAICLIGSVVIVLHAPPDEEIETIDKILDYAIQPGFLFYCLVVGVFSVVMIYHIAPRHGKKNPLIYLSICSTVGSVSIMAVKAFGIALKLTFGGNNQFTHPSTYVFMIVTTVCILTQMNYFNKALSHFSTSLVNPLYYVTFTTATLTASFILFRGFNTSSPVNTISLLCGFLIIFAGVYLLNLSREDPEGMKLRSSSSDRGAYRGIEDAVPTDALASFGTRRSMQARRSSVERDMAAERARASRERMWNGTNHSTEEIALMQNQFGLADLESGDDEDGGELEEGKEGKRKSWDLEQGSRGPGTPLTRLSGSGMPRTRVERETQLASAKAVGR